MMKRYSAALALLGTLCAAGSAARAQVLQIDADGTTHKIGPGWTEPVTSPMVNTTRATDPQYVIPAASPQTLQLLLNGSGGLLEYDGNPRLRAVRNYVASKQNRRSLSAGDETVLANAGYAHIRDINYDPNSVIRLAGCVGFQTTIEFASDEHIENVGVGAASRWLIVPNKQADLLFVEPAVALSHSNMTVVTDHHRYYFELVSRDSDTCGRGAVIYSLRLHYPTTTPNTLFQSTAWRNP